LRSPPLPSAPASSSSEQPPPPPSPSPLLPCRHGSTCAMSQASVTASLVVSLFERTCSSAQSLAGIPSWNINPDLCRRELDSLKLSL
jgi:hypothetical protein